MPALEDLIPDSALDDPEGWANEGAGPQEPDSPPAEGAEIEPQPEEEMPALEGIELAWPDRSDDFLPDISPLAPQDDIQFADLQSLLPDQVAADQKVRLSSELTLAFPSEPAFTEQAQFVARFRSLSTIEELGGGDANIAQLAARALEDEELLQELLRVYGYYDGKVYRELASGDEGDERSADSPGVTFEVIPGEQYRFGLIDLGQLAEAGADYDLLRNSFEIQTGDPLLSDRIIEERYDLDTTLGENGYPFASIKEPSLLVDHARQEGDLTMPVQPGGKYNFGRVVSSMPEFLSGKHLEDIARFESGDVYRRSDEMDLRRAILATGLVSSVTITPREAAAPSGTGPGTVDIDVDMEKAPLRTLAGAIGYGTGEGFQVRASWEHRNLFPPEGKLAVRGIAGTREQLAGVTFTRNNFKGRDRILSIDAYARNYDGEAYTARTASLTGSFERVSTYLFQKKFSWGFGLELLATDEREQKVKGSKTPGETYLVAALPVHGQIDTTESLLDPQSGMRFGGRISPEVSHQNGVTSTYIKSQFDLSAYQPAGDSVVLAARARLGTIYGAEVFEIAPSRRFYAGGGGSVRGYGYEAIGPVNGDGIPNGGRSLVEASVEARIKTGLMGGAVSVVPFVDAGAVDRSSFPTFNDVRFGAGIGMRYETSFGPLRVDVATPINPRDGDSWVAVYVALGQAF